MKDRLARERMTVEAMIGLYCQKQHRGKQRVCGECAALLDYSVKRLANCRYGVKKPACSRCDIHCYRPDMRDAIRAVMRFSGPRILLRHPWLALAHMADRMSSG